MGKVARNSPNGCWAAYGYKVERYGSKRRKVYAPSGELIFDHGTAGYEVEIEYCERNGLLMRPF